MPKKIDLDIDQLRYLYLTQNLTKQECADILKVSLSTISRAIQQYELVKDTSLIYKKIAENNLAKYGVTNIAKLPSVQDKIKSTCINKYGTDNAAKAQSVQQKAKQTNLNRYGYTSVFAVPSIQEKIKSTCRAKYGVDYVIEADSIRTKISTTNLELYGGNSPFCSSNVRAKAVSTNIKKYGVPYQFQAESFKSIAWKRYKFDGTSFDSSLELMLWIYAKDHGESIEREPVRFTYNCNGKLHYYTPDFLYKNELIDIKGSHLVKDGKLIDVFGHLSTEELAAKQQCLIDNGVRIIIKEELKPVIAYVETTYGRQYIKQFKNSLTKES